MCLIEKKKSKIISSKIKLLPFQKGDLISSGNNCTCLEATCPCDRKLFRGAKILGSNILHLEL